MQNEIIKTAERIAAAAVAIVAIIKCGLYAVVLIAAVIIVLALIKACEV